MTHGALVLDPQDVEELFNWHGGQGSAVYSLASTAARHTVTADMVESALSELRRDLKREEGRIYLHRQGSNGGDRLSPPRLAEHEANVESLGTLINNLEIVLAYPEEHQLERLGNPVDWDAVRERVSRQGRRAYAYAREKGGEYGRRAAARGGELAADAQDRASHALRRAHEEHVKHIDGQTCVCTASRKDNPFHGGNPRDTPDELMDRAIVVREAGGRMSFTARFRVWMDRRFEGAFPRFDDARYYAERLAQDYGSETTIRDEDLGDGQDVVWRSGGSQGHHRRDNPAREGRWTVESEMGDRVAGPFRMREEAEDARNALEQSGERFRIVEKHRGAPYSDERGRKRRDNPAEQIDEWTMVYVDEDEDTGSIAWSLGRPRTTETNWKPVSIATLERINARAAQLVSKALLEGRTHGVVSEVGGHHRHDNPARSSAEDREIEEQGEVLAFEVTSDGTLYPLRREIESALRKKLARGVYDSARAPQAFAHYVDEGAKALARERGEGARWFDLYPTPVRRVAARIIAESVEAEMKIEAREPSAVDFSRWPGGKEAYDRRAKKLTDREDNPVYPAIGPERMDNPVLGPERADNPAGEKQKLPLKLLQPRLGNPAVHAVYDVPASVENAADHRASKKMLTEKKALAMHDIVAHGYVRPETIGLEVAKALLDEKKIKLVTHDHGYPIYVSVKNYPAPAAGRSRRAGDRHANPLKSGCSKEVISENIDRELGAHPDMSVAQGVAIAYSHARAEGCKLPSRRRANPVAASGATEVADVILEQLGGMNRLGLMVGAKNFVALEHGVQFSIGSGAKSGINKVRVVLQPSDTYDVEFWKIHGAKMKKISEWGDVYNNQLMDLFEKETGMHLTIKARKDNPSGCAPCAAGGAS